MFQYLPENVQNLLHPINFIITSALYLPGAIWSLLSEGDFAALLSWKRVSDTWFARFWGDVGPQVREGASVRAHGLIESAYGVVVEVGPGSGEWIHQYDKTKVTKIYGIEPNKDLHAGLERKIKAAGLSDIYVIVPVGVEDLGDNWVAKGEVDSIVTLLCLCSVSSPEKMIASLYDYLRVGGQWIVYEHVVNHKGGWIERYQRMIDLVWPTFIGGCSLRRDTEKSLREVGDWSSIDLAPPASQGEYTVLPHITGYLRK